jgi:hypothetical protein
MNNVESTAEMTPEQKARVLKWIKAWKEAGPVLEEVRAQEIRAADTVSAMEILDGMFTHAVQTTSMRESSGLIEQQEIFARVRR